MQDPMNLDRWIRFDQIGEEPAITSRFPAGMFTKNTRQELFKERQDNGLVAAGAVRLYRHTAYAHVGRFIRWLEDQFDAEMEQQSEAAHAASM